MKRINQWLVSLTFAGVAMAGCVPGEHDGHDGGEEDGGSGQFCGGIAGIQCAGDQYCNFPASAQCGAGDQGGTCATRPQICPDIVAPVCGCDDKTYNNGCDAARQGVSVAHNGEC